MLGPPRPVHRMPPDPLDTPRALREALQRFAAVFEQAPVAMVVGGFSLGFAF